MDRTQFLLLGLPLFLLCSDLLSLFTTPRPRPPPNPSHTHHHHHHHQPVVDPGSTKFPSEKPSSVGGVGLGNSVNINFCSSCSYRGKAETMKRLLQTAFPGTEVILANHPPPAPKRLLSKVVPVVQIGVIAVVVAGEQILPILGFAAIPPWYYYLRANKFGTIASTWLLGNALQSFLHSTGAFEVYFNGELVFSKLREGRFPGEIGLKDLIDQKMASSKLANDGPELLS